MKKGTFQSQLLLLSTSNINFFPRKIRKETQKYCIEATSGSLYFQNSNINI
jgi:hypothetical protein